MVLRLHIVQAHDAPYLTDENESEYTIEIFSLFDEPELCKVRLGLKNFFKTFVISSCFSCSLQNGLKRRVPSLQEMYTFLKTVAERTQFTAECTIISLVLTVT